jgi:hypothetical protein
MIVASGSPAWELFLTTIFRNHNGPWMARSTCVPNCTTYMCILGSLLLPASA